MKTWIDNVPEMRAGLHETLLAKAAEERRKGPVYPPEGLEFHALELTPFESVRVVILGQDPYHGPGQAHGLAFSVPEGAKFPPSLRNIFKEVGASIHGDAGRAFPSDLTPWAEQGVLLLNTVLTVAEAKAGSHRGLGWQELTDSILKALSAGREHLVFMLWGNDARSKSAFIDTNRHLVLEAVHPSPLSAHRGFLGCGHFARANDYLVGHGEPPIRW